MKTITSSASKLVFLLLAITACAGFIMGMLPVDQFMLLAVAAFSFYFSHKGEVTGSTQSVSTTDTTSTIQTETPPFAGK